MFNIIIFRNEEANLAHVMISMQDDSRTSIPVQYAKARWLIKKNDNLSDASSHLLSDAFIWFLQNTHEADWIREVVGSEETIAGANFQKVQWTKSLQESGYQTTEARGSAHLQSNSEGVAPKWAAPSIMFKATNTSLEKLKKFAKKCSAGMDIDDALFHQVVKDCYLEMINKNGPGEISKFSVWSAFKAA